MSVNEELPTDLGGQEQTLLSTLKIIQLFWLILFSFKSDKICYIFLTLRPQINVQSK